MVKYPLVRDTINNDDIDHLIQWLQTYPRLTKGPLTIEFEKRWASWLGTKRAIYVNSGSSANLLMLYSLILRGDIKQGDSVIVPAISWATDLSPVIQFGLKPILCDCNMDDLSIDINHFEELIEEHSPKALMFVSVLGLVPEMDRVVKLCNDNGIALIEDTCESLGSMYNGKKLGTFGLMSSFSLYFGHHISTVEGGMICTDDDDLADIMLSIRNHGWDRDWSEERKKQYRLEHNVKEFDALYKFYYPGFNVRSTDLQAKIGLRQLGKLDEVCRVREKNFQLYLSNLSDMGIWLPKNSSENFTSNFCFPIVHDDRDEIARSLIEAGVECRPLIAGSMGTQPMYTKRYGALELKNASRIDSYGMYVPNNQSFSEPDIEKICDVISVSLQQGENK
jgi:CDP-4-dehydro-6-deoxyglucose reductase, E1